MIANNSVRTSIALTHLAVALCCFSIFFLFFSTEADLSFSSFLRQKEFLLMLVLNCIGVLSFCGFLSWQGNNIKISKSITYLISLFFLIEMAAIFFTINIKQRDFIFIVTPTLIPAIGLFLLAFSKIYQLKATHTSEYTNYLDSDFLNSDEETHLVLFWKPNRVVSFTFFVFSILSFPALLPSKMEAIWIVVIPSLFLVFSIVLWFFPKIGSWFFTVVTTLMCVGIVGLFVTLLVEKPISSSEKLYIVSSFSVIILSIILLCSSLSMLLLSKEAQQQWNTNNKIHSPNQ